VPRPDAEHEIDIRDYVYLLWRRRFMVIASSAAAGVLALTLTLLPARRYEAVTTLALPADAGGPSVSIADLRGIVESPAFADALVREHHLNQEPYSLSGATFLTDVMSVEQNRDAGLVHVRVRLTDPSLAAKVANAAAEKGAAIANQLGGNNVGRARDLAQSQMQEATNRLQVVEKRLVALRNTSGLELLRQDVELLLADRRRLTELEVQLQAARAKLARARQELASPQVPAFSEKLGEMAAETLAEIAVLERTRGVLSERVKSRAQLSKLHESEIALERLDLEYGIARRVYDQAASRYEQARLPRAGGFAIVVDTAQPPLAPLPRPLLSRALMAAMIGLVIGVLAAFAREVVVNTERPRSIASR
jgi:uncharacterized protein involved in exopolysaccharide biosynthesis